MGWDALMISAMTSSEGIGQEGERGLVEMEGELGFPCYLMVERDRVTALMSHMCDIFS